MSEYSLWRLPTQPGTIIAIGEWWLVRLRPYETTGAPPAWELLPMATREATDRAERNGVKAQCVYSDEWVMAESEQEGGYYVISEPVHRPWGPHIRTLPPRRTSSDSGSDRA